MVIAVIAVTFLSLGYDMTHPPLAGIITSLNPARRGQALGLNAFVLFTGFGPGSLVFQLLLRWGFGFALVAFAVVQTVAGLVSIGLFRRETAVAGTHHG